MLEPLPVSLEEPKGALRAEVGTVPWTPVKRNTTVSLSTKIPQMMAAGIISIVNTFGVDEKTYQLHPSLQVQAFCWITCLWQTTGAASQLIDFTSVVQCSFALKSRLK